MKLTAKQERFCREYIVDLNATQAAKRAGYSNPRSMGSENLTKPDITQRIAELQAPVLEAVEIDAQYVLRQAKKLHERCMQEITPVMVREGRETVPLYDDEGRQVFQFNAAGAAKALEIIGKHVDVQAFLERHKIDLPTDTPDTTAVPKTDWAALRAAKRAQDDKTVH